ncbi:hypothetical protein HOLleu_36320 [Holothuria leucospilota]|uniref:ZU5 domain-containing protein n=1 Tax=Holothuria leucospilota TaxID=206669 RepID=A0A9Q0YJS7_HOLLE|nr:hypothetical protein HOLleu_36320 [Holothuria leucospilota]
MCIPGTDVRLKILPNSLPKGVEQARIRMEIIAGRLLRNQPVHSFASNSSVVVELLPNYLQLQRCALLTLPHCLKLKTTSHNVVKVFVSHHSKDSKPCWEEKPQLDYQLDDKGLTLQLDTFCWVKYEIDDEIVEAKKIQVFAARPNISQEDEITKIELGYHPDLPGAGEVNAVILS